MEKVRSKDGTQIAYEKSGSGLPLIIVGGSLADHSFYSPLAKELAKAFTVYNFDRRGRGESSDTLPYSVEREVEDIMAIANMVGEPVVLYGHSAGSALALNAAAAGLSIAALILADPPYTPHGGNDKQVVAEFRNETAKVQELHDKGEHRANVAEFLAGFGLPDEAIEGTLDSPTGAGMVANAKALPYDYAVLGDGLVPTDMASQVKVHTFILSSAYSQGASQQLADAIPGSVLKNLSSSTHEMAPEILAETIKGFLL